MAPANTEEGNSGIFCRVTAGSGITAECGAAVSPREPLGIEDVAAIRAEPIIDLAWLDAVETALHQLQRRSAKDPVLVEALAIAARLRAALIAPGPADKSAMALWFCLYCCISLPFLNHFSSAIGEDLGHAMAHQIVKILSSMAHHFEF